MVDDILADEIAWGSVAAGRPGMEFTRPRASKEEVVSYFEELAHDICEVSGKTHTSGNGELAQSNYTMWRRKL